jgi:hypothetical protein
MRIFTRLVIVAALCWLGYVLFVDCRHYQAQEDADQTKIAVYFIGIVTIGIVVGCVVALSLIPAIGDHVGDAFFNPNQEIERDPHSGALAKIAQGDFEGAIAHFYCDKLRNFPAAGETLEKALEREWPAEESAFLCNRLVDVYWTYQHNAERARSILIQVAETLPDTRYAANALHRMRDIERALETGTLPTPHIASADEQA